MILADGAPGMEVPSKVPSEAVQYRIAGLCGAYGGAERIAGTGQQA